MKVRAKVRTIICYRQISRFFCLMNSECLNIDGSIRGGPELKIATVVGTRPQFIKAAAVSSVLRERHREVMIHTGQHYDPGMSQIFFSALNMPVPEYHMQPGHGSPGRQLTRMFGEIKKILEQEKPDLALVYGDSRTTLAGGLAASCAGIPFGHIEAGLRSYDLSMPEEFNRIITDRLAAVLFCPSQQAVRNLAEEGYCSLTSAICPVNGSGEGAGAVYNVGDVTLDAINNILSSGNCVPPRSVRGRLKPEKYLLATVHRAANTDNRFRLDSILAGLAETGARVVLPLHPRTRKKITAFGLEHYLRCPGMTVIEPVGYPEMVWLLRNAARVVTDSGGLQREAFLLRIPCIILRRVTEWVETVERGCSVLVDCDPNQIRRAAAMTFNADWSGFPYGRGEASRLIVRVLEEYFWPG